MRINEITPAVVREFWNNCVPRIDVLHYIDDVAAVVGNGIYERFADSLVMARVFLTVPFQSLPKRQQAFASELARSVQLEALLSPNTPVLSLLATRGCTENWNDPRKSHGHVAIPLLSEAFVGSIPMMSRLLKELGLPLTWVQEPGAAMMRQTIGSEIGFFYVEDACNATDELGRKIIAAQDFVSKYSVRSVFSVGGTIFGGAVLLLILFSRDRVEQRTVRTFMPITNLLKGTIISQCSMSKVFRQDKGDTDQTRSPSSTSGDA